MTTEALPHYLRAWALCDPQPLAQTATSTLYTVQADGARAVLKLLTPLGAVDEQPGAAALRCFDGHGAVRLLRHDDHAHLLEYAEGPDLVPLVRRGEDDQATAIIAGVLNHLHRAPTGPPPPELRPLPRWFRALFAKAETDRDSIFARGAAVATALLAEPRDERVLHGDMHHENVRYHDQRGWLAFDPKGLYGERTYDAANTLCNPVALPDHVMNEARLLRQAAILAEHLAIERARLLAYTFAYACLSAAWSLEDGHDARLALRVAHILAPHVTVH